jgi:murein DD-endopeptidase MepM/ murein hydrolase activator NlpD
MPAPKSSYHLVIAGKHFPIDWPTYTFEDPDPGFNAHLTTCTLQHSRGRCGPGGAPYEPAKGLSGKTTRLRPRRIGERTVEAARAVIKQFVLHLDGCLDAEMCFNVLHNERGLSCHFILDNDGTLYQTCDLIDCAYHAAGLNESSIGIEICNRGDAKKYPNFYDGRPNQPPRDVVTCTVNGHKYIAYEYTKQQYDAMTVLGKALAKYLPGIKLDFPQSSPGMQHWGTLDPTDLTAARLRASYSGYIGHYHITSQKWDPGPFDFKKFLTKLAGRRAFPIGLHGSGKPEVPDAPPPSDRDARAGYDKLYAAYYDNNELVGRGGYFPVGPVDRAQLYHGGVHFHPKEDGGPVYAPFAGKVIMARNGQVTIPEIGSTSFVLLSHSQKVGDVQLSFYSLYMHLAKEDRAASDRPKFMGARTWADAEENRPFVLDPPEPVQAGDVIGHVGVGPGGEPQLHWEIFTLEPGAVEKIDTAKFWIFYSGAGQSRFCTEPNILKKVDIQKKDGIVTLDEVMEALRGDPGDRDWAHRAVTNHYSEWSWEPDWKTELLNSPELKKRPPRQKELERMVTEQILPTLWWDTENVQAAGLPSEARVFTYHPITFLKWLNDLVGQRQEDMTRKATDADYATATGEGKLDIDDKEGTSFVSEADLAAVDLGKELQLPDLIDGYGD